MSKKEEIQEKIESISDEDKHKIETLFLKFEMQQLQMEKAKLEYEKFVSQMFHKYQIYGDDVIKNDGVIVRGKK